MANYVEKKDTKQYKLGSDFKNLNPGVFVYGVLIENPGDEAGTNSL